MTPNSSSRLAAWGARLAGVSAAAIGSYWMVAWLSGVAAQWAAGQTIIMKTNMAVCMVLAGTALLVLGEARGGDGRRRVGSAAAAFVLLIGTLTLSEHLFGYNLGIDQLLATEAPGAPGTTSPNRMGVPASTSLVVLGTGLLMLDWRRRFAPYLGVAVCLINLVPLVGYLYHIAQFYSQPRVTAIAWPSVIALMCLGTGLVLAVSEAGPVAVLGRKDAGGQLFRRWLPLVVLVPLVLGFLRIRGQELGLYERAVGNGMLILALVVIFTTLLWLSAERLSRSAQGQAAAEAEMRSAALFPEENPVPVLRAGRDGRLLFANRAATALLAEWRCAVGGQAPDFVQQAVRKALDSGAAQELEVALGERSLSFVLMPIAERAYVNFYGSDITARKRAEFAVEQARNSLEQERNILQAVMNGARNSHLVFLDREFNFVRVNETYARTCGCTPEEMVGKNHFALYPHAENEAIFARVRDTGEPAEFHDKPFVFPDQPERGVTYWDWTLTPVKDAAGNVAGLVLSLFETTRRKQAEAALRESEQRVRSKLESVLSPEGDLGLLELADLLDTAGLQKLMDDFYAVARIPMSIIDVRGRVLVGVGWQDICTQFHRVNSETCRHCLESDLELSAGLRQGQSRLYKCKNLMWDMATPIIVAGQHVGNVFTGQFFFEDEAVDRDLFSAQARRYGFDEAQYLAALDRAPRLTRETVHRGMNFFVKLADTISQLGYSNAKLARFVAERDRLTESMRQQQILIQTVIENCADPIFLKDRESRFLLANPATCTVMGKPAARIIGKTDLEIYDDLAVGRQMMANDRRIMESGQSQVIEEVVSSAEGPRTFLSAKTPFRDADGRVIGVIGVARDITERKQTEVRLKLSLREKEVMLKEIHHRVKNNLQVIASLVDLQTNALADPALRTLFADVRDRVRSMALVHEKLYQSESLARVEFADYARSLLNYLSRSHGSPANHIQLKMDLQPVSLSVETAVPCGLILNELVSNAFKHAFRGRAEGQVTTALGTGPNGRVFLRVSDNGVGLPAGMDWRQSRSLGLRLIHLLAGQLSAVVEVRTDGGTEFLITLESEQSEERKYV